MRSRLPLRSSTQQPLTPVSTFAPHLGPTSPVMPPSRIHTDDVQKMDMDSEYSKIAACHMLLSERAYVRPPSHVSAHPNSLSHKTRAEYPMRLLLGLAFYALVVPAAAVDEPYALSHASADDHRSHRIPIGLSFTLIVLIGHYVVAFSGTLVGPLMGITSVLWLMMRNDAAINPKASWMVFGAWSVLTLTYFIVQCHRVFNHRLYILLTIAVASVCMCLVASVQKSTLQGGLVTAIPTCTSFAAYAVAYFFPDRYIGSSEPWGAQV